MLVPPRMIQSLVSGCISPDGPVLGFLFFPPCSAPVDSVTGVRSPQFCECPCPGGRCLFHRPMIHSGASVLLPAAVLTLPLFLPFAAVALFGGTSLLGPLQMFLSMAHLLNLGRSSLGLHSTLPSSSCRASPFSGRFLCRLSLAPLPRMIQSWGWWFLLLGRPRIIHSRASCLPSPDPRVLGFTPLFFHLIALLRLFLDVSLAAGRSPPFCG